MIIIDSSVWVAWFHTSDSQYNKAVEIFENLSDDIGITEYCVLEVATVLQQKAGKKMATLFLRTVSDNKNITIILSDNALLYATLEEFKRLRSEKLSFVDVSLLVLSKEHQVLTFDTNLQKQL